jgi:hypothetical protein
VIFILILIGQVSPYCHGFFISVKSPPFIEAKSPWPDTLVVNVRTSGRFFVNGEEIERDDLRARLLVLLCHKRRVQQNGQQVSRLSRNLASLIRSVAIEYGLCRSARMRRAAGLEVGRNFLGA